MATSAYAMDEAWYRDPNNVGNIERACEGFGIARTKYDDHEPALRVEFLKMDKTDYRGQGKAKRQNDYQALKDKVAFAFDFSKAPEAWAKLAITGLLKKYQSNKARSKSYQVAKPEGTPTIKPELDTLAATPGASTSHSHFQRDSSVHTTTPNTLAPSASLKLEDQILPRLPTLGSQATSTQDNTDIAALELELSVYGEKPREPVEGSDILHMTAQTPAYARLRELFVETKRCSDQTEYEYTVIIGEALVYNIRDDKSFAFALRRHMKMSNDPVLIQAKVRTIASIEGPLKKMSLSIAPSPGEKRPRRSPSLPKTADDPKRRKRETSPPKSSSQSDLAVSPRKGHKEDTIMTGVNDASGLSSGSRPNSIVGQDAVEHESHDNTKANNSDSTSTVQPVDSNKEANGKTDKRPSKDNKHSSDDDSDSDRDPGSDDDSHGNDNYHGDRDSNSDDDSHGDRDSDGDDSSHSDTDSDSNVGSGDDNSLDHDYSPHKNDHSDSERYASEGGEDNKSTSDGEDDSDEEMHLDNDDKPSEGLETHSPPPNDDVTRKLLQEKLEEKLAKETNSGAPWAADTTLDANVQRDLDALRKANDAITKQVQQFASRITVENYERCAQLFNLDLSNLVVEYELIPFPPQWKLAPNAALYAHQWLGLSEMLFQGLALGGGADGSKMGVGKTYQAAALAVTQYWIVRMQRDVADARNNTGRETAHHPPDHDIKGAPCNSQKDFPMPCPCSKASPTHPSKMEFPSGAAFFSVVTRVLGEWVNCFECLFRDAPILTDKVMPIRICLEHKDGQKLAKEKALSRARAQWNKEMESLPDSQRQKARACPSRLKSIMKQLTSDEMAELIRIPDWGVNREHRLEVDDKVIQEYCAPGLRTKAPHDATIERSSYKARQYIIISTPNTLANRLKSFQVSRNVRKSPKHKTRTHTTMDILDCGLFVWDEAHNFQKQGMCLKAVMKLQEDKLSHTSGERFHYWALSGTIRENGPSMLATHIGCIISLPNWTHPDTVDSKESEDHASLPPVDTIQRIQVLQYVSRFPEIPDTDPPWSQFADEYKNLLKSTSDAQSIQDLSSQKSFQDFTQKMARIVCAFVIERDQDTIRLDGTPLLKTADIQVVCHQHSLKYDAEDIVILTERKTVLLAEQAKAHQIAVDVWNKAPQRKSSAPKPVARNFSAFSAFYDVLIASTTPRLLSWEPPEDEVVESFRVKDILKWQKNPAISPFANRKTFDAVIQGDKKWEWLVQYIKACEKRRKSVASGVRAKHKILIGTRLPIIAHIYYCGLAHMFGDGIQPSKFETELEKRTTSHIAAHMKVDERMLHTDIFNVITSKVCYFVCTIDVLAEGVNMTGANHVVLVDPHPRIEKVRQFAARPHRFGQQELKIYVRQLFNEDSTVDTRIMLNHLKHNQLKDSVSKTDVDNILSVAEDSMQCGSGQDGQGNGENHDESFMRDVE